MLTSTVATIHDNSAHGGDNYLVRDLGHNALLDAVMDGVTGRSGGPASRSLVEALAAASLTSPDDVVAVLEEVNQTLYQRGGGHFLLTTVAAVLFLDGKLYVIGVGDSTVFLIGSNSFQQLSSSVSRVLHAGVARAIGASKKLVNLYRAEVTVEPGDRVVLATDGITDNLTSRELGDIVRSAASPDEAAERIRTILATRHESVGARHASPLLPAALGGGFRRDDWTAIFRFFSPAG